MKLLVSPGLPRCGTTYLYAQLGIYNRASFNTPTAGKETNFFFKSNISKDEFAAMYNTNDNSKYYIDFSPAYLLPKNSYAIDNLCLGNVSNDVKIILHIRNPLDQAYAHYLHDIAAHVSKREFGENVSYLLFGMKSLPRYFVQRSHLIKRLLSRFGRENILVLNFYRDFRSPVELQTKIERFIGVELQPFHAQKVGVGGWVPYYIYAMGDVDFTQGTEIRIIPAKSVLLVNGEHSVLWRDLEPNVAINLLRGSATWCHRLDKEQCALIYERVFRQDFEQTCEMLGENPSDYPTPEELTASAPALDARLFKGLQLRTTLEARLSKFSALDTVA
jgi:hypothetical protein